MKQGSFDHLFGYLLRQTHDDSRWVPCEIDMQPTKDWGIYTPETSDSHNPEKETECAATGLGIVGDGQPTCV